MSKIVFVLLLFTILIADNSAREIQRNKRQPPQGSLIGGLAGIRPGIGIGPGGRIPRDRVPIQGQIPRPVQPPRTMIDIMKPGIGGSGPITVGGGAAI